MFQKPLKMCFNHAWLLLVSFVLGHSNAAVNTFDLFSDGISLTRPSSYTTVKHLLFPHDVHTRTCTRTHLHTQSNVSYEDTGRAPWQRHGKCANTLQISKCWVYYVN